MQEQSIQIKQQYLREKILSKGHDAQAFMLYCQEIQGKIDLDEWSFDKLKELVQGFLGEKAQATFTQQQLDEEQWCQVEPDYEQSQKQSQMHAHKQIVFSEADWGIFGLPPPSKSNTGNTQMNFKDPLYPNISMSPPSVSQTPIPISINFSQNKSGHQNPPKTPKNKEQSPKLPNSDPHIEKKSINKQFQELKMQQISSDKVTEIGQIHMNVIKGKQLQQLPLINDIKVIKTQQKTRNFLQGDYTLYHIQFSPGNHVIQRKFNDFRKLRNIIQKIYPHVRMPYLQPEGWLVNSSEAKDQQTLNKYKYMIIEFLKYITIRNDLLKKSKIVRIFTGFIDSNPTDFKKYQNIAKPKIFSQLCLPHGNLTFPKYQSLSPVDKYMNNTQILSGNVDNLYQKLRKSMQTLFYNYDHVSKSLLEIAGIFESLENLIQAFNIENNSKKDLHVYEGIKQVCFKMKDTVDGQYNIFKNQIQALFKYQRDNMTTLKQVNQVRSRMFNEYARQGLLSKKSSEFSSKGEAFVDGNISIDEPCKNNKNILNIQNMFWSYYTLKNAQDYWNQLRYKINQRLTMIAYEELDSENSILNFWNTVIKKCVT